MIAARRLMRWIAPLAALLSTAAGPPVSLPKAVPPRVPSNVVADFDVRYGEVTDGGQSMDVYRRRDAVGERLPCVVWVHGGAWFVGDKRPCKALPLIDSGFVVASVNYRLSSAAPYPAQIHDCKGAIRYLRAHAAEYHIDPDRIGVWGESAGAHLAILLGTSGGNAQLEGTVGGNAGVSSRVQAVVDWFGPTDLTQFADQAAAAHHPPGRFLTFAVRAFVGGEPTEHMDLIALANPIRFLPPTGRDVPPFLIMHGDRDRTVPVAQSRLLDDALKAAGVPETFRVVAGLGHGFPFARADVGPVTLAFLKEQLRPTPVDAGR